MENRDRTRDRGDAGQGGKPNKGGDQQRQEDRGRQDQGGKGGARPSPSGVPNEARGMVEGQARKNQSTASGAGKYRGGQQGQGGVPNPDDADDNSPGSFRGSVDQGTPVDETDDGPQEVAVGKDGNKNRNSGRS